MNWIPRLVLITDPRYDEERIFRAAESVCQFFREDCCIQLRDPHAPFSDVNLARRLRALTTKFGAKLMINRNPVLAKEVGADGVHVDISTLDEARALSSRHAIFSVPAHNDDDVHKALAAGATFAYVSPIFETPGKQPPRGLDAIRSAREIAGAELGIVALGGVDHSNAISCFRAGAHGIAGIRALFEMDASRMASLLPIC